MNDKIYKILESKFDAECLAVYDLDMRGGKMMIVTEKALEMMLPPKKWNSMKKSIPDEFLYSKVGTSQNYLGGGMLGKISFVVSESFCINDVPEKHRDVIADAISTLAEFMKKYHYNAQFGDEEPQDDAWEWQSYEQNQVMPRSSY